MGKQYSLCYITMGSSAIVILAEPDSSLVLLNLWANQVSRNFKNSLWWSKIHVITEMDFSVMCDV